MKATLKFESGKELHISLQPEGEEESAECNSLARYFNNFREGTRVPFKLAYTAVTKAGDEFKEIMIGIDLS
jgi:hypothetical protein